MFKLKISILTFLFILFCFACTTGSRKVEQIIDSCEEIAKTNADSAINLLDSVLLEQDELSTEQYHKCILLRTKLKDNAYKDISSDSILFETKDYYVKDNDVKNAAVASYFSGRVYEEANDKQHAMICYLDAEAYLENSDDYAQKGLVQFFIGNLHYEEYIKDEAIVRFKKADEYFTKAGKYKNQISAYHMIGNAFILKGENDSAFVYYKKGLAIAVLNKDTASQVDIEQNIGLMYIQKGNIPEAKTYLRKALANVKKDNNDTRSRIFTNMAKVFYKEQNVDSTLYYANAALAIGDPKVNNNMFVNIYELLLNVEKDRNNYKKASEYYEHYNKYLYLMMVDFKTVEVLDIQNKYSKEVLENINNRLKIEKQSGQLLISLLGFCIVVIVFFFYLKAAKNKRELLEAHQTIYQLKEMAKTVETTEEVKGDPDSVSLSVRQTLLNHFDIITKVGLLEGYLRDEDKKQGQKLLKKVNEIIYGQESIDWEKIYDLMNQLHNNFADRLRKGCPLLDESEFKICCLTYANLSNTEIAILMKLSLNTIQSKKSNIRKKLKVKEYGRLFDFLDQNL